MKRIHILLYTIFLFCVTLFFVAVFREFPNQINDLLFRIYIYDFIESQEFYKYGMVSVLSQALSYALTLVLAGLYLLYRSEPIIYHLYIDQKMIVYVSGFIIPMIIFSVLGLQILDVLEISMSINDDFTDDYHFDYYIVSFCIVQLLIIAPAEEILFRGIMYGFLKKRIGSKKSIVLSSLTFALFHLDVGGLIYATSIFFGGIIYGYSYEKTQNILTPILIHGLFNIWVLILSYGMGLL